MKFASIIILLSFTLSAAGQKEFFRSQQVFKHAQLEEFYSSVAIENSLVLFVANDFRLYAYDKNSGRLKWMNYTDYKTNTPAFVAGNYVYAGTYINEREAATQLDTATGQLIKQLPVGPLATKPLLKGDILFGTAIYDGGCLFAYDTKQNSLLWWRFLAHGYSRQPYYLPGQIQANAEGKDWVTVSYQGQLTDSGCKEKADLYVEDISCTRKFYALTHDGMEINGKLAANIFESDYIQNLQVLTTAQNTFILYKNKLHIIGNKGKLERSIKLSSLSKSIDPYLGELTCLLKAGDKTIYFMYKDWLVEYDFKRKKTLRLVDLSAWKPHQAVLDGENLWLISKKDGLLYGLSLQ